MTTLPVTELPVPLREDRGVIRVGQTRVTLDAVITAFAMGATAEEIAQEFPTLDLGDIYAVIAYYLRQRAAVEAYLADQRGQFERARREQEARFDPTGLRDRLLARRHTEP
jgi:uncharacterized protein (DUF433 family)